MKITMNKNKKHQTFEGFGASGAWWAQLAGGWDNPDPESGMPVRDRISQLLYSKTDGIGLRTYRYNIGGGSVESGKGDFSDPDRRAECFENDKGEYDFTKDANAVYMMRQAAKDGADEIILFVNSPIERLTKNNKAHLDKNKVFRTNLSRKNYGAFAKYILDVTEHFVKEGLPVRYLSPVNEPLWIWNGGQEGCHYSPYQAGKVMQCVAREMRKRKTLDSVMLSGVENGDIRWFNKSYTREMLRHKDVRECVDSVDVHSYFLHSPLPFTNNRPAFLRRYRKWMDRRYPDVPVKMSEWCHMNGGKDTGMVSALETAKVIFEDISILNVTSWQHWIACSRYDYCDGLIYIDPENQSFEMTKRYYVTGNFSKYIPYGAVRFEVKADDSDIMALGFEKDSKTVLIIINPKNIKKSFSLSQKADVAVTDNDSNLREYTAENEIELTPQSVTTVIF
ncbi:MAG: glycoside hydrolase [Acutalibacteraceae bacterium]|nr:glycoside hydrolase [Acutalibacteraceae bacterium]